MNEIPIACTLNKQDRINRQNQLKALRNFIRERRHLPNGFALRFDGSTENLMVIAQVIAQERECCRFLQFQLLAEPNLGSLWLEVSGSNKTAQFLFTMFGLDEASENLPESSCI